MMHRGIMAEIFLMIYPWKPEPRILACSWRGLYTGLGGNIWTEEFPQELEALVKRKVTPGQFLIESCDEKFVDEALNDEGNAFATVYFQGSYFSDYERALANDLPTCYHVADTWENFEKLSPVLDQRFDQWKNGELKEDVKIDLEPAEEKQWWKFW